MKERYCFKERNPLKGFGLKHHIVSVFMRFLFFLLSEMSQLKHADILKENVLQDVATGQLFKLHPTEEEMQRGIWEYNSDADGARWHHVIVEGITYAINELYIDWDDEDVQVWSPNEMGQWPFGNRLTEAEVFMREVDDVLFYLDCYLESELEWMDAMEDLENEVAEDADDSDDDDVTSEDEGYNTSPEVDFELLDYWALGLNSFLWRIDLYKEGEDGFWTL